MGKGINVLIIEDDSDIRKYFVSVVELLFGEKVQLTFATGLEEAFDVFNRINQKGLDLIFVDACLRSQRPNSMPLISHITQNYFGPIYAMSCNKHYVAPLLKAGCNATCTKRELPHKIEILLKATP